MTSSCSTSTRERILAEARKLIHRKGLRATSISEILEAADVRRGTLYHYFSGKHELAVAMLNETSEEFMSFLDQSLDGPSPRDRLYGFFDAAYEINSRGGFVGGCLFGNIALEASDTDPELESAVTEVFDRWSGRLESVIEEGQQCGQFRSDLPSEVLARHVVMVIEGGLMQARLRKEGQIFSQSIQCIKAFLEGNSERDTEETNA
jgi:TetR/AcrR family transcriptional repressor of nem operon